LLLPTIVLAPLEEDKLLSHGMSDVQVSWWWPTIVVPLGYEDEVELNDGDAKYDTTSIYNWSTYDDGGAIGGLQLPYKMQQVIHKDMHTHEAPFS
jgi:hypothetical protein